MAKAIVAPKQSARTALNKVVFVFGSNLAGRHGAGSALLAHDQWGAEIGVGVGRTGDAYAIPTKDANLKIMRLDDIEKHVREFIRYAHEHMDLYFMVVAVGTGLAGIPHKTMKQMFRGAPMNCYFSHMWSVNE